MPKRTVRPTKLVVASLGVMLGALACGRSTTPPPLVPDGPDMELDAAAYQDDGSAPETSGL